jgi:hypothetical protein
MPEPNEVEKNKALMDFRAANFAELESCLKVSKEIRDDPEVSARDRNTAVRNIAALLGALTVRGDVITKGKAKVRVDAPENDAHKAELETYLNELQ